MIRILVLAFGCLAFFPLLAGIVTCSGGQQGGTVQNEFADCLGTVTLDFPLSYTLEADHIAIDTGGGVLKTMLYPWGAHVQPFTGHLEGNGKSDWAGFFAFGKDDPHLTELEDNDPGGKCLPTDLCGIEENAIISRIPQYVAPDDNFEVFAVVLEESGTGLPFSDQKWRVEANLCNYRFSMGHIGRISGDLRQAIIDQGLPAPETVTVAGTDLLAGTNIMLSKGQTLAEAEVVLTPELAGYPGYYNHNARALLEYTMADMIDWISEPKYLLFPQAFQDQLESILFTEANKVDSFIFSRPDVHPWLWRAEMELYTVPFSERDDYSSIFTALGGWWERADVACIPFQNDACDLLISIFPIIKSSPFYDASLYHSSDVSYLVGRRAVDNPFGIYFGEVVSPAEPDPVSGILTIKWRKPSGETFQTIAYTLFPALQRLKIRWGVEVDNLAAVDTPAIPSGKDTCDGNTLTCHSREGYWGGSGGP